VAHNYRMDTLPKELLIQCFVAAQWERALCASLRLVSRRLRDVVDAALPRLLLQGAPYKLFSKLPPISFYQPTGCVVQRGGCVPDLGRLKTFPQLRSLTFGPAPLLVMDAHLRQLGCLCTALTSLRVASCLMVTDEGLTGFGTSLTQLQHLSLKGCHLLSAVGLRAALGGLPALTSLELAGVRGIQVCVRLQCHLGVWVLRGRGCRARTLPKGTNARRMHCMVLTATFWLHSPAALFESVDKWTPLRRRARMDELASRETLR